MQQSRWKSPAAWSAFAALALFVLKTYGLLAPIGLTEDSFKELTTLLFAALTALITQPARTVFKLAAYTGHTII